MTDKITEERLAEIDNDACDQMASEKYGWCAELTAEEAHALILEIQSFRSAQAGEVEVVAWMATESPDGIPDVTLRTDTADAWRADEFVVTPLITLSSHQSVIAAKDAEIERLRETIRQNKAWDFPADIQELTLKLEASEARADAAVELLDHLIGWIVHDCGAEVPFTDEQDATYQALNGAKP